MRSTLACALLASLLTGCATPGTNPAVRGVQSVSEPVLTRGTFAYDAPAADGYLSPADSARLDGWFRSLELCYGDRIYLDGAYPDSVRSQVADIAGRYGMMISPASPVTAGVVAPGTMRVVVSRNRAEVPACPNWSVPSRADYTNSMMSNFGCGVNPNLAAMVANPQDLFHGRPGDAASDGVAGAKAVQMYRDWPLTGVIEGQAKRPLKIEETKGDQR